MDNKLIVEKLNILLANLQGLSLKTQNYHWNVTGPNFKSLHSLFEEQYNDLSSAIDTAAERIRCLNEKAPASWDIYKKLLVLKDGNVNSSASEMIKDLAEDQDKMITLLKEALLTAQNAGDEVTIGFIVERMEVHEKNSWILNSSL